MNQRPTIREQMDACRPDSDDLHLPEHAADLAELLAGLRESAEVRARWEQSQHEGRMIRGAMQDVSLPAGLEARLLAAVHASQAVPLAGVEQAVREEPLSEDVSTAPAPANRRRWFMRVAGGLAGTAALVLVGVLAIQSFTRTEPEITRDELASRAEEWLGSVDVRSMVKSSRAMAPPGGVNGTVIGSSSISTSQGTITAYSVRLREGSATLLVIPTSRQYPVNALPYSTITGISGGLKVGAWQRAGVLYVIAVPDNAGTSLDQFVPRQPIG
jgi:negative regulator of sigma E activity